MIRAASTSLSRSSCSQQRAAEISLVILCFYSLYSDLGALCVLLYYVTT